jgi:K+-transporting ATPase ATPase C chain
MGLMFAQLKSAVTLAVVMTLLLGVIYPCIVTLLSQAAFPHQAAGSLLYRRGVIVGSSLVGQAFSGAEYFWSRPSATTPMPYNGANSAASNLGPSNPDLAGRVGAQARLFGDDERVPVDLLTASASGLDPDISLAAAQFQVPRVAAARHLPVDRIRALLEAHQQLPWLLVIGEPRVNVLELNLALDELK